ncbi:MAG: hypothetical protein ACLSFS_14950 [Faecalibacillus intestinalis]
MLQKVHPGGINATGKELSQVQQEYLVDVIMTWIQKEMENELKFPETLRNHGNQVKFINV